MKTYPLTYAEADALTRSFDIIARHNGIPVEVYLTSPCSEKYGVKIVGPYATLELFTHPENVLAVLRVVASFTA